MDAHASRLNDPKLTVDRLGLEQRGQLLDACKDGLWRQHAPAIEYGDASRVLRRKPEYLAEIAIE